MTRAIFAIVVEVLALGFVCVLLRWANGKISERLAGATPAPVDTRKARTGAAAQESPLDGSTTPARAPLASSPRWPVLFYSPCERGYVAHQFEVVGELAAAHVALYRVPRFGNEARA